MDCIYTLPQYVRYFCFAVTLCSHFTTGIEIYDDDDDDDDDDDGDGDGDKFRWTQNVKLTNKITKIWNEVILLRGAFYFNILFF